MLQCNQILPTIILIIILGEIIMAMKVIQKVWLHGHGCECGNCMGANAEDAYIVFYDKAPGPVTTMVTISSEINTIIKDQYGQMYIITPIPEME